MEKQENIYRQKSLDRISSPEQLDSYLKVTTPSVWLVLIGIILILVGIIGWASVCKLNTYVNTGCFVQEGSAHCFVLQDDKDKIKKGMSIFIADEENKVENINLNGMLIPNNYDYLQHLVGVDENEFVFEVSTTSKLVDGFYECRIVVDSISPIKFIFN